MTSAVVDKRLVDKIADKTAILRKYDMSTMILFCRHNSVLFWKRKDTFKKQIIDKPSKRLDCLRKALSSECSSMLDTQPVAIYPASPDDHRGTHKFGFWSEYHCIYFLTIVLSTIVAVGKKFDLTCRQRNLSSTTALMMTPPIPFHAPSCWVRIERVQWASKHGLGSKAGQRRPFKFSNCLLARWTRSIRIHRYSVTKWNWGSVMTC